MRVPVGASTGVCGNDAWYEHDNIPKRLIREASGVGSEAERISGALIYSPWIADRPDCPRDGPVGVGIGVSRLHDRYSKA